MDTIKTIENVVEELTEVIPDVALDDARNAQRLIDCRRNLREVLAWLDSEGAIVTAERVAH